MFIHTSQLISEVFLRDIKIPVIIQGPLGSSRNTYLRTKIRQLSCLSEKYKPFDLKYKSLVYSESCNCVNCQKIKLEKSADFHILTHESSIEDMREVLDSCTDRKPIELPFKIILYKNIDRISKSNADTLLKLMEEPGEDLRVFATSEFLDRVPSAILSRSLTLNSSLLENHHMQMILEDNIKFQPFKEIIDEGIFNIGEAKLLMKLDYKTLTHDFMSSKGKMSSSIRVSTALIQKLDDCEDPDKALLLFIRNLKNQMDLLISSIKNTNPHSKKIELLNISLFKRLNKNLLLFLCTTYRAGITDRDSTLKDFFFQLSLILSFTVSK